MRAAPIDSLTVHGLACTAGHRQLFAGLECELPAGHWMMLTGPNGCGKSTLLRAIAGLREPQAGEIRWCGAPVRSLGAGWNASLLYQGHLPGWKDALTPAENLAWQLSLDGVPLGERTLADALARAGLARQARLAFSRLSAGQRRRLGLARIAAMPPQARPVWLLDEPATALDSDGLALLGELLDAHLALGGCAVVATHQSLGGERAPLRLELSRFAATGNRRDRP